MKILHTVESYLPSHHGMSEVVRQISERLAAKGHEITVATRADINRQKKNINGVNVIEFEISGNITDGIQGEYDKYIQFLLDSEFDIVTNFAAQQWATDLALPILTRIRGKKIFVPTGFSGLYLPQYQSYFTRMKEWLKTYDKVIYLSEDYRDINLARELGLSNGVLIPNGASEEEFSIEKDKGFRKKHGIPENDLFVLHVSGYVGGKGHMDAIRIFTKANLKHASLLFVSPDFGSKFDDQKLITRINFMTWIKSIFKNNTTPEYLHLKLIRWFQSIGFCRKIQFVALTRAELVQAYKNADLFLFPSNLECSPIVLFECMAGRTPFLVTDVGNAKEIVEWSGGGKILPTFKSIDGYGFSQVDISSSISFFRNISTDKNVRRMMEKSGHKSWKDHFTWKIISDQYESLYLELLFPKSL